MTRRTTTLTVRLKPGDEPVELTGQRLMLGLSTPGPVPPGVEAEIKILPQLSGWITTLLLDKNTAEAFDLLDFRVGRNSQFVTSKSLPLAAFAAAPHESFPDTREIRLTEDRFRELLDFDVCQPGMEVIMKIQNMSGVPLRFRGAAIFLAADGNI